MRRAERLGVSVNAVKLASLLRRSPVVLPIPGTLSIEHLRENLAALDLDYMRHGGVLQLVFRQLLAKN